MALAMNDGPIPLDLEARIAGLWKNPFDLSIWKPGSLACGKTRLTYNALIQFEQGRRQCPTRS